MAQTNNKIKFAWDIHYKCNFRCPYCWFYRDWARLSAQNIQLSPDEWLGHWQKIYDKYGEVKIEIVGGEPFIYPGFIELAKKLSSLHLVKVTTNLSGDIERFAQEIDPRRVELDLNFHILFIDLETVVKKALILQKAGFKAGVCYLAYPPQMYAIKSLSERFKQEGINFALAAFWGEYQGKTYPAAYTQEEKKMMRPFLGNLDRLSYHLNAQSPKGKLCNAGYRYASIKADGKVVRCGQLGELTIGNITDQDFSLFDQPLPCTAEVCPCDEYVNLLDDDQDNNAQPSERSNTKETVAISSDSAQPEVADPPLASNQQQIVAVENSQAKITVTDKGQLASSVPTGESLCLDPPYRVHWNWELGYSCNYNCSYCDVWPKGKSEKHLCLEFNKWKQIWDNMFAKYWCTHVRFSGGEPTIFPNFFEIVAMLLEKHTVDITTNLSFEVNSFRQKVAPGGISISASFHPEFEKIEPFLEKVLALHGNSYPTSIAYVAYPPHLKDIQAAKALVERNKVLFKIIPFKGTLQGRKYPDAYTKEEKLLIEGLSGDSENNHLNDLNSRWYDWNVKKDQQAKSTKGQLCRMGQMYAKIHPDGQVTRCCVLGDKGEPLGVMGHISDLNFRLWDSPQPCPAESCPCFKGMLVGAEEEKWLPLWEGPKHPVYKLEDVVKLAQTKKEAVSQGAISLEPAGSAAAIDNQIIKPAQGPRKILLASTESDCVQEQEKELINSTEASGPLEPSTIPRQVFFTWDIHYACNYRCEYCFFAKKWQESAKQNKYPGIEAWKRIWDNIYQRYGSGHIHVSGGEPFTYPDFMDLVRYLTGNFTVEFDTNLSFDLDQFLAKISPGRVKFATAFHPTFVSLEEYKPKVLTLKQAGFDIGINYVAYPLQLQRMKEYMQAFQEHQVSFTIMPFRGEFCGRDYPLGYTEQEKKLIVECDSNLTISEKMLNWYGKEKLVRKSVTCRMGQMYTKIHPNGDAFRCCFIDDRGRLGNLIQGSFALWDEAKLCEYPECPCWTAMVIGQEPKWQSHWVTPKEVNV